MEPSHPSQNSTIRYEYEYPEVPPATAIAGPSSSSATTSQHPHPQPHQPQQKSQDRTPFLMGPATSSSSSSSMHHHHHHQYTDELEQFDEEKNTFDLAKYVHPEADEWNKENMHAHESAGGGAGNSCCYEFDDGIYSLVEELSAISPSHIAAPPLIHNGEEEMAVGRSPHGSSRRQGASRQLKYETVEDTHYGHHQVEDPLSSHHHHYYAHHPHNQQISPSLPTTNTTQHVIVGSSQDYCVDGDGEDSRLSSSDPFFFYDQPPQSQQQPPQAPPPHSSGTRRQTSSTSASTDEPQMAGGYVKPSYSYSCLIGLSLKNSLTGQLTVSEIYAFLCEHFPYFRAAAAGWKNSVRHNLSLNKCFQKIEVDTPGSHGRKSCLWKLNPQKASKMEQELRKWRERNEPVILESMANPADLDAIQSGTRGMPANMGRRSIPAPLPPPQAMGVGMEDQYSSMRPIQPKIIRRPYSNSPVSGTPSSSTTATTTTNRQPHQQQHAYRTPSSAGGENVRPFEVAARNLKLLLNQKASTEYSPDSSDFSPPPTKKRSSGAGSTGSRHSDQSAAMYHQAVKSSPPDDYPHPHHQLSSSAPSIVDGHLQRASHHQQQQQQTVYRRHQQAPLPPQAMGPHSHHNYAQGAGRGRPLGTSSSINQQQQPHHHTPLHTKGIIKTEGQQLGEERSMSPLCYPIASSSYDIATSAINDNSLLRSGHSPSKGLAPKHPLGGGDENKPQGNH